MSVSNSRWAAAAHRISASDAQMRVSDAERADVADRLSKHYGDGRLDQAEFNERLDRAMKAKTRADLTGLFSDLPGAEEPRKEVRKVQQEQAPPRGRRPVRRILGLILIVVVTVVIARALMWPFFGLFGFFGHVLFVPIPWILVAIVAFLAWRYVMRRRHQL
jgi:hypothetical protein